MRRDLGNQGMVILEKRKLVDRREELFDSTIQIREGLTEGSQYF